MPKKRYLVTYSGVKKDTGEISCWASALWSNARGEGISDDDRIQLDDRYPVGTILEYEMVLQSDAQPTKAH